MSSIIRATTTSGLQVAPDNSGSLQLQTNGTTTAVTIDTSQNVGIGVTPSAWNSRGKAIQLGNGSINTSLFSLNSGLNGLANNMYVTASTDNYIANGEASRYYQYAGTHVWDTATSGTAGNTITFTERMRIDSSGNLLFNSGYGSVATAYGCRAWVNFNGTGTVAIRASGNVTSITDNGTGDYTFNFTNSMPDVNYSVASNNHAQSDHIFVGGVLTYNTGSVRMYFGTTGAVGTAANTRVDATNYGISVFR